MRGAGQIPLTDLGKPEIEQFSTRILFKAVLCCVPYRNGMFIFSLYVPY